MKYKLTLAYDGTAFSGWQIQPNGISIQELVQKALQTVTREEILLIGSGRTDAGVHALCQTAHFSLDAPLNGYRFLNACNALLPPAIKLLSLDGVSEDFHARYSTIGKKYRYCLHLNFVSNPFERAYSWHVPGKCDVERMQQAIPHFLGTHDFTSFANEAKTGACSKNPVRSLRRLEIVPLNGGFALEFEGDGFLYKMVRNIVGTLVDVGRGKIEPAAIPSIILGKNRSLAGRAAPPHGLFLVSAEYPESDQKTKNEEHFFS